MNNLPELDGHPTAQLTDEQLREFLKPHFHIHPLYQHFNDYMRDNWLAERDRGGLDATWIDIQKSFNRWVADNEALTISSNAVESPA